MTNGLISYEINGKVIKKDKLMSKLNTFDFPRFREINNLIISDSSDEEDKIPLRIYTDGSKMSNGTSAAFVSYLNELEIFSKRFKLGKDNSIFIS